MITQVAWDLSPVESQRRAHGSDLWPCAWAADGDLYCAWGDGGGFEGDDDRIGRVSLGFARIGGSPSTENPAALIGTNIWGSPPFAATAAQFGGKVGSMIAIDGVLYAHGGFWTAANSQDPVHASGRGPISTVAWSSDSARTWHLADWSTTDPLGGFLDAGQDSLGAATRWVYLYYIRHGDDRHVFLKRVHAQDLIAAPQDQHAQYFSGTAPWYDPAGWFEHGENSGGARWSAAQAAAVPVFADENNVEGPCVVYDAGLGRYLLTAGHYASGHDDDSSAGQVGLFEAPQPWGPWRTVSYDENWGNLHDATLGDFLGLRLPSKWISADGKTVWAVFSGLHAFDSFNLAKGVLTVRR